MTSIAVIIDSGASIIPPPSNRPLFITVPQTVTIHSDSYPDWQNPSASFYESLSAHPEWYKTSATNAELYFQAYEANANWAKHILCIVPSPKLSAAYNSARIAQRQFEARFGTIPEIQVINSKSGGPGISVLILYLAQLLSQGSSIQDIKSQLIKAISQLRFIAIVPSLSHLRASGRVPWIADLAAKALGAKFIIELSDDRTKLLAVTKHMATALHRLIKEAALSPLATPVAIVNANNVETNDFLSRELKGIRSSTDVIELNVSAAVATHVGPGFIGLAFMDNTAPK